MTEQKVAFILDIEKNLVLVKGEDKTEEVIYCEYNPTRKNWNIKYANNDQYYNYRPGNY